MREKEREGSTKGKGGLYKKLQIPTLSPKWPRSGVTFHFESKRILFSLIRYLFQLRKGGREGGRGSPQRRIFDLVQSYKTCFCFKNANATAEPEILTV